MTKPQAPNETREKNQSLWLLAAAPLFWAGHLLLSYSTAAVFCAKFARPDGSLFSVRVAIAVYTFFALLAIGVTARIAWSRYRYGGATEPYDADTPAARHRFLGFAALLLAALSAVATVYVALVALFFRSCQ